jgi:hypothetical protein
VRRGDDDAHADVRGQVHVWHHRYVLHVGRRPEAIQDRRYAGTQRPCVFGMPAAGRVVRRPGESVRELWVYERRPSAAVLMA